MTTPREQFLLDALRATEQRLESLLKNVRATLAVAEKTPTDVSEPAAPPAPSPVKPAPAPKPPNPRRPRTELHERAITPRASERRLQVLDSLRGPDSRLRWSLPDLLDAMISADAPFSPKRGEAEAQLFNVLQASPGFCRLVQGNYTDAAGIRHNGPSVILLRKDVPAESTNPAPSEPPREMRTNPEQENDR